MKLTRRTIWGHYNTFIFSLIFNIKIFRWSSFAAYIVSYIILYISMVLILYNFTLVFFYMKKTDGHNITVVELIINILFLTLCHDFVIGVRKCWLGSGGCKLFMVFLKLIYYVFFLYNIEFIWKVVFENHLLSFFWS